MSVPLTSAERQRRSRAARRARDAEDELLKHHGLVRCEIFMLEDFSGRAAAEIVSSVGADYLTPEQLEDEFHQKRIVGEFLSEALEKLKCHE
jgi:hypothetical protein